jgi:hypothetical protein
MALPFLALLRSPTPLTDIGQLLYFAGRLAFFEVGPVRFLNPNLYKPIVLGAQAISDDVQGVGTPNQSLRTAIGNGINAVFGSGETEVISSTNGSGNINVTVPPMWRRDP